LNDDARAKLRELVVQYGPTLCNDPRRCEALLRDVCGEHRREIHLLVGAVKERVAADLLDSKGRVETEVLLVRLVQRLEHNMAVTHAAARWTVQSWVFALGIPGDLPPEPEQAMMAPPPSRNPVGPFLVSDVVRTLEVRLRHVWEELVVTARGSGNAVQLVDPSGAPMAVASFQSRYIASAIDWTLIIVGLVMLNGLLQTTLPWVIVAWLYFAVQQSLQLRTTIGERACGIMTIDADGNHLSFLYASIRYWAKIVSAFLVVGLILSAYAREDQTIVDRATKTFVIAKP